LLEAGASTGSEGVEYSVALARNVGEPFNLGLACERRGMLATARDETDDFIALDRKQPDARNMMCLIYAKTDYAHAREVWNGSCSYRADFEPAGQIGGPRSPRTFAGS